MTIISAIQYRFSKITIIKATHLQHQSNHLIHTITMHCTPQCTRTIHNLILLVNFIHLVTNSLTTAAMHTKSHDLSVLIRFYPFAMSSEIFSMFFVYSAFFSVIIHLFYVFLMIYPKKFV